ncbi:MAG TPA: hypothetical protein V6C78_20160 [Crinalium sp.]
MATTAFHCLTIANQTTGSTDSEGKALGHSEKKYVVAVIGRSPEDEIGRSMFP